MGTYEYIIASKHTTNSTRDHYHSVAIDDINAAVLENIPNHQELTDVTIYLKVDHDTVFGTLGNADLNIWCCNNGDDNSGHNLYSGKTSTSSQEIRVPILDTMVNSIYPYRMTSGYSRLAVFYDSTTKRVYNCDAFKIIYTYKTRTYKAYFRNYDYTDLYICDFTAGTTPVYKGVTPTKPSDDEYDYVFSGWEPTLEPTFKDISYRAQFTAVRRKINKIYVGTSQPKAIYVGTQEVKAVYVGTTKVYG